MSHAYLRLIFLRDILFAPRLTEVLPQEEGEGGRQTCLAKQTSIKAPLGLHISSSSASKTVFPIPLSFRYFACRYGLIRDA